MSITLNNMNRVLRGLAVCTALSLPVMGIHAAVKYVTANGTGDGSSWEQASGDLQAVIDASSSGDEVWVAAGTYHPTSLIKSSKKTSKAFILKNGVSLYGGFAGNETSVQQRAAGTKPYDMTNVTVLSADDDVPDVWERIIDEGTTYRWSWKLESGVVSGTKNNSTHVIYCADAMTEPTVVDGFTLTGANANVWQAKAAGGAVYALGTVAVKNCRITENSAYFTAEATDCNTYGGAVYLDGGTMEHCYVARSYSHSSYGNGIGGGVYARNTVISDCVFEDCVGLDQGGAVFLDGGKLEGCRFARCYSAAGGAVYNNGGMVNDVDITDCRSLMGGGIYNAGNVTNALIRGCYADAEEYGEAGGKGGAIFNNKGTVAGCAAFNNSAWQGGGVFINAGQVINATILNNTVRAAEAGGANVYGATDTNLLNSISDPATAMVNFVMPTSFAGRATTDAQAVLLETADWSLAPGSEFIDKGTAVDGYASGTDLAGNPRVYGASIDCGAYEFQGDVRVPTMVLTFAPGTQAARLGLGGVTGYEFTVDWGDGKEETYDKQAYYSHVITGSTVKVYGDDVILLRGASQGIVAADLSRAGSLVQVMLGDNGLTSLSLGNHPSLTGLYAERNQLTSIDVSGCPALRVIDVHENGITGAIDCSAMNDLSKIDVADNKISSLKLPKQTTLYEVDCSNNELESLDVTGLGGLSDLSCSGNRLTSIDLTGLTSVTEIYFDGNALTGIDISPCTSLEKVMVAENAITSIDLSKNGKLSGVYVQDNKLTSLDLSANPSVRWLNLGNNSVSSLDVSAQKQLSILIAANNKLTGMDLSQNTSLSSLDLSGNALTTIDLGNASYLSQCHLENNAITTLDVSKNPYLYGLFCGNNQLTSLDITGNTYLQRLEAQGNALTALDVTKNTGLQELLLQSNNMDKSAVNAVISALPDVSGVQITDETKDFIRQLNISNMPGTAEADVQSAEAKGWMVTAEYAKDEPVTVATLDLQINRMGERAFEVYNATIEYANEEKTSLYIQNFMESGARVVAKIDAEGNVQIAPQVCGGDGSGNYYMIVNAESKTGNPMAIYNTYVAGKFDGETLTLEPWNLIIVPYTFAENLGVAYQQDVTSTFVKSNGTMAYTTTTGAEVKQNIYASVKDAAVSVYGWGVYGSVTLTKAGSMWAVDAQQPACTISGTDYVVSTADGAEVVSTSVPDPRTLLFGAWQLKAATGSRVLRDAVSAILKLGFDLPSITTGVDAVSADACVVDTVYVNAAGVTSAYPHHGLNIKVEMLSDGSRRVTKFINRF